MSNSHISEVLSATIPCPTMPHYTMPHYTMPRLGHARSTIAKRIERALLLSSMTARSEARQHNAIVANASMTPIEFLNLEPLSLMFTLALHAPHHHPHHQQQQQQQHRARRLHHHHHHLLLLLLAIMSGLARGARAGGPFGYPPFVEENEDLIMAYARNVQVGTTRNGGQNRVRLLERNG